ncbi:MAG: PEP-CTERM sorting domain-containing protein [Burkholderiaceae bacterium]|nr:PEP-CTERM sorting domain-containing protein [Burkholderiaceae bacterium]
MKVRNWLSLCAVAASLACAGNANAGVVIDLFTDPITPGGQVVSDGTVGGGGAFSELDGLTNVIGGSRDLFVETTAQQFGFGSTVLSAGGGFLSYSQATGVTGVGVVQWDGDDNSAALDTTGLGGADLTDCNGTACQRISASVLRADFGFGYEVLVADMDGRISTLTASTQFPVNTPTHADYYFDWFNLSDGTYFLGGLLFSIERTGNLVGDVDFTNIGALQFTINVPFIDTNGDPAPIQADIDLTLSAVTTVPEPGALSLVGAALLGVAAARRRRKTT